MARGRRTLNRRDLRAAAEAAERVDKDETEDEEEEEGDEDEEEEGDEEEGEGDEEEPEASEEEPEGGEEDDEEAPPKKKKAKPKPKAKPKAPKAKAPKRVRTPKTIRQKAVWIVYNNSHTAVARYEYKDKGDADAHAARLNADKKTTHFVQLIKEPWEEKKE
jgi:hypothetical protein